jgi:SAM-dependent methyltransferase
MSARDQGSEAQPAGSFDRVVGRTVFGADPAAYAAARPPYPGRVFEVLRARCRLAAGTPTLEIGAGTGLATAALLENGAAPLDAIEPDERLARVLRESLGQNPSLRVVVSAFEDAALEASSYRLIACATAFHWLEEAPSLQRIRELLAPGGWWAVWWHVFGDDTRLDPFHDATRHLGADRALSPSAGTPGRLAFALDVHARHTAIENAGLTQAQYEVVRFDLTLDTAALRRLYATFSETARLAQPERDGLLDAYADVADHTFGGRVTRPMQTIIYTARRQGR